ncbi:hypothetical protein CLOM_g19576 [Closterium sp. NIES-68]|nr:hypothetical protein CLOM_g19576 [Closterium sp. NIES-68]GJP84923.1 hypothetical protein CLOP_g14965 [Closterium sp. NIES-67]
MDPTVRWASLAICAWLLVSSICVVDLAAADDDACAAEREGKARCEDLVTKVKADLSAAKARADSAESAVAGVRAEAQTAGEKTRACEAEAGKLRKDVAELTSKAQSAEKKAGDQGGEVRALKEKVKALEGQVADSKAQQQSLQSQISSKEAQAKQAEQQAAALKAELEATRREAKRAQEELKGAKDEAVKAKAAAKDASECHGKLTRSNTLLKETTDSLARLEREVDAKHEQLLQVSSKWLPPWLEDYLLSAKDSIVSVWTDKALPAIAAARAEVVHVVSQIGGAVGPQLTAAYKAAKDSLHPHLTNLHAQTQPVARKAVAEARVALAPLAAVVGEKGGEVYGQVQSALSPHINQTWTAVQPHVESLCVLLDPHLLTAKVAAAAAAKPLQPHWERYNAAVRDMVVAAADFFTEDALPEDALYWMVIAAHILALILMFKLTSTTSSLFSAPSKKAKKPSSKSKSSHRSRRHHSKPASKQQASN